MKKVLLWSLVLVICISMTATMSLAGCKKAAEETAPAEEATEEAAAEEVVEEAEPVEITYWHFEPREKEAKDALTQAFDMFNAQNPNIHAELVMVPKDDFNVKLQTAVAAGAGPDASIIDQPLVATYASQGALLSLDGYISQEEKDEFVPGALETNYYKGELFGLPLDFVCVALYYNKALVPNPPETWDELLAIAEEVSDPDNNIAAIQIPGGGYGAWIWPAFVAAAGGTMLNEDQTEAAFNNEAGQAALQLWVDLIELSPKNIREAGDAFPAGHLAFLVSGPWEYEGWRANYPDFKDYGITLIPMKTQYATNIGGQNLVAYSSSKNPDAAVELLKFLTTDEIQSIPKILFEGNPSKKALKDLYKDDPDHQVFSDQLQYATARPAVVNWIKINDEVVATAIDRAFAGESVKQVLDEAAEQANAILATEPQ